MSTFRLATVAVAVGLAATASASAEQICAPPRQNTESAALSWLVGDWIQTGKTQVVRERWSGPYGGALLGIGVTTRDDQVRSFEYFRIARTPTGLSYFASPNAAPPTEFKAVEICTEKVVFENKTHDFPQRVIYAKGANGALSARIEGTLNGKPAAEEWTYRPDR